MGDGHVPERIEREVQQAILMARPRYAVLTQPSPPPAGVEPSALENTVVSVDPLDEGVPNVLPAIAQPVKPVHVDWDADSLHLGHSHGVTAADMHGLRQVQ